MTARYLSRVVLFTCDNCQRTAKTDGGFPEGWGSFHVHVVNGLSVPCNADSHVCAVCVKAVHDALDATKRTANEARS